MVKAKGVLQVKVSTKLWAVVVISLLALAFLGGVAIYSAREIQNLGRTLYAQNAASLKLSSSVALGIERAVGEIRSVPSESDLQELKSKQENFEAVLSGVKKSLQETIDTTSVPNIRAAATQIIGKIDVFGGAAKKVFEITASSGQTDAMAELARSVTPAQAALASALTDFDHVAEYNAAAKVSDMEERAWAVTRTVILVIALLVIGLAIFSYIVVSRGVSRPISALTAAMKALASGNENVEIAGRGRADEIGAIAEAVEVFKQNAIEKRLSEGREALERAASTARRQEEIDQLVGFFGRSVSGVFTAVSAASTEMAQTSSALKASAAETGDQAKEVMAEVEQTGATVQTVASASQQLSTSIEEIGRQASESSRITGEAIAQSDEVVVKVTALRDAAKQIGTVVELISSIASQTNLLALNATIEAARAGEAGRGFAVVAAEVKALADQTAKATDEIGGQINSIQAATAGTAEAIQGIAGTVHKVNEIAASIASAVVEQSSATQEIARSVEHVSDSTTHVARSMERVQGAVAGNTERAAGVERTAATLASEAQILSVEVRDFLGALKDLGEGVQLRSYDLDVPATATLEGRAIPGRVAKASLGFVLFFGPLTAAPGALMELRIEGIDRALRARFIEAAEGGVYLQLPLNHKHLLYMEEALHRIATAKAA